MTKTFLFFPFLRLVSNCAWFSSLVLFFIASVVFSVLLHHAQHHQTALRTSRVVILEGLIFSMGVALGVCIIVVSHSISGFETTCLPFAPSS